MSKRGKKINRATRSGAPAQIWLPEAYRFGRLLGSSDIRYAIFGAGALAVHNVLIRPTIDIDFVVNDYNRAIALLDGQPGVIDRNLARDKDGIPVADFHFQTGISVQIWDNNLYSLPMTDESWFRIRGRPVPGYDLIMAVSMEDLVVSKVGRFTQQRVDSQYEADKNIRDVVSAMAAPYRPDIKYVIRRLKEGARRERSTISPIHSLDWYFVREVAACRKVATRLDISDRIQSFVSGVLSRTKTRSIEYWLLHILRKNGSIQAFQTEFMLDHEALSALLKRWRFILKLDGDKVSISSKTIQGYLETLEPDVSSEYAKRLAYSGKG
jgi:hypothetical protein